MLDRDWPPLPSASRRIALNGRRGAFLLLFGAIHLAFGLSYIGPIPPESQPAIERALSLPLHLGVPLWALGAAWLASGAVALVSAFRRHPPGADGHGFQALIVMWAAWAMFAVLSQSPRGWVSAFIYLACGGAVGIVSGMVDPERVRPQAGDTDA